MYIIIYKLVKYYNTIDNVNLQKHPTLVPHLGLIYMRVQLL